MAYTASKELSGKDICYEDVNFRDIRGSRTAYHEVTLDKGELVGQTLLRGVGGGTLNLVIVVVETDDIDARELDNLTRRAADTAANIQYAHVVGEVHLVGQVVLVAGNGLVEGLAVRIAGKVEGLAPAVLVQVGGQVVVVPGEGGIFVSSFLGRSVSVTAIWAALRSRTFRVSSVSSEAALLSQCLKYSSTALSFCNMAVMPPLAFAEVPCMALLKAASRLWSSCSSAVGDIMAADGSID
jgi:hypothetical protein